MPTVDVDSRSVDASRSDKESDAPAAAVVEPGAELAQADFASVLRATGAKYIVLQVYMESCGPCMTEALRLTEKKSEWRASGIAILGLGMDETPDGPKAFHEHTGRRITYPLYLAPWFAEKQEVFTTPTLFIYDANGAQLFRTDPETAEEGIMASLDAELSKLSGAAQQ